MSSPKNAPDHPPGHDSALTAWGTLAGAGVGAVIGLCTGHWLVWAVIVGAVGMIAGGLVDRSRRK